MELTLGMTIGLGIVVLLGLFAIYVTTRPAEFRYERSGVIGATPEIIFPYISQLKRGGEWSPYEKRDPSMKKVFSGTDGQVGAALQFDGNKDAGSGSIEILKVVPLQLVDLRLNMTKPFSASNLIEYRLLPEANGTRFIWVMSGKNGFLGKLVTCLIDCEKMIAGDFEIGIANLKQLVESQS